jgi:hypothetical protein
VKVAPKRLEHVAEDQPAPFRPPLDRVTGL